MKKVLTIGNKGHRFSVYDAKVHFPTIKVHNGYMYNRGREAGVFRVFKSRNERSQ